MSERRMRSQLYYAQDEIQRLRAKLERARELAKEGDQDHQEAPRCCADILRELDNGGGDE